MKGPGANYFPEGVIVAEAVAAGSTATFEIRIRNQESAPQTFNVAMDPTLGMPRVVALWSGSVNVTATAQTAGGYTTAAVLPTKAIILRLTVTPDISAPQGSALEFIYVTSSLGKSGVVLPRTEIRAPARGTQTADLFVRQGLQAWVGGSVSDQVSSAPSMSVGGSATFNVKLQNDSPVAAVLGGYFEDASCADFKVKVKDGLRDVTDQARDDTYRTPLLAPGKSKTLAVTVTRVANTDCAAAGGWFHAHTLDWSESTYVLMGAYRRD